MSTNKKYNIGQLRGAWGAGRASSDGPNGGALAGSYFHSFTDDGQVEWQGKVLSKESDGTYCVQLFSWLDGRPTDRKIVSIDAVQRWRLYSSLKEMTDAYAEIQSG